jgi:hypothetical protein
VASGGFWPVKLIADHRPTCLGTYRRANTQKSAVLLGCGDGYLRRFDEAQSDDDGTDFESAVTFGPHMISDGYHDGMIRELSAILDAESGQVAWRLAVAETPEQAVSASTIASGDWTAGASYKTHPMRRGAWFVLRLKGLTGNHWAVERVQAVLERYVAAHGRM